MDTTTEIRALTREEIEEAFACLTAIEGLIGSMPFRDGVHAMANVSIVRDIIGECFPGGYIGECEVCDKPIGADEVAVSDFENGCHFCASCAPTDQQIAEQNAGLVAGEPRSDGRLNIVTKHLDIRNGSPMPDG